MKPHKLIFTLIVLFSACGKFPSDINEDPGKTQTLITSYLFTGAELTMPSLTAETVAELYSQHMSEKQYTDESRYSTINFDWNYLYAGPLVNLKKIIDLNTDATTSSQDNVTSGGSSANQIAAARILKAWYFLNITDRWGDCPYSQALQGSANFIPAFDKQEDIYNSLFDELSSAAQQFDGGNALTGDIIYNGDNTKWQRFANSLRLVMALRVSKADAVKAQVEFSDAFNAGIMQSNDDNAVFIHTADSINPWYERFLSRSDYCWSETMANYMLPVNDPRIPVFANPRDADGAYVGMPYGVDTAGNIAPFNVSFIGDAIRQETTPTFILTYAEVLFALAEGAHNGWIAGGDAQAEQYYSAAIQSSWNQWLPLGGLSYSANDLNAFLNNPVIHYTADSAIQKIAYQKWVHLYLNGYEAWAEYRRTGFPVLQPAPNAVNSASEVPRRQGYPVTERDLNSSNYNAAVSSQGIDDLDTHVWWDQ